MQKSQILFPIATALPMKTKEKKVGAQKLTISFKKMS